jgi:hypothetical protein
VTDIFFDPKNSREATTVRILLKQKDPTVQKKQMKK